MSALTYLTGFGNELESEAVPGALPRGRFSPQQVPGGLYAEKFSLTAFTVPRAENRRTWFYRIRPAVVRGPCHPLPTAHWLSAPLADAPPTPPEPMRWSPPTLDGDGDFINGLTTVAVNGSVAAQSGIGVHLYATSRPMDTRCLLNADGEMLLVPQSGALRVRTECGLIEAGPGEIVVVPRGMKFAVDPLEGSARGYVCENYGQALRLPERGPVGSDGFANDRDFAMPVAAYVDQDMSYEVVYRFQGALYAATLAHCPFDVVAWAGNALPYKYDCGASTSWAASATTTPIRPSSRC